MAPHGFRSGRVASSLPGLGGRGRSGLHGLAPRAPTGNQRGKAHGEDRKGRCSKSLHASQRIGRSRNQKLRASRDAGLRASWVPWDSQVRTGFLVCRPVIRGATSALPWVPSSSVLEPDLGQRRGVADMRMRRSERHHLGLPLPLLGISQGEGQVCCPDSQGNSVHPFHLALVK